MNNFEREAVTVAIKQMFDNQSFSICTIDACLKITCTIPDQKIYNALRALHCVPYAKMSPTLRLHVINETIDMLSTDNSFDFETLLTEIQQSTKLILGKAK